METSKAANKAAQFIYCLQGLDLSCPNWLWLYHATGSCTLLAKRCQIFFLLLGIMLRVSCRVEKRVHHHKRDIDSQPQAQVPPDLCIHHPKWCRFSLMLSRMRSSDRGWWGGLAEDRERWALADEWEFVRKRMKEKTGMARSTQQLGRNSTEKLTPQKRSIRRLRCGTSAFPK